MSSLATEIASALGGLLSGPPVHRPDGSWNESAELDVWRRLLAAGWTRVGLAEALGGSGGGLPEAAEVASTASASGHLLPLADAAVGGFQLLTMAGMPLPAEVGLALAVPVEGRTGAHGTVSVEGSRIPWTRWATHLLVVTPTKGGSILHLVQVGDRIEIVPGSNLAGEPRDGMSMVGALPVLSHAVERSASEVLSGVRLNGALARSIQMVAAIERVLALTVSYTDQRHQFGRALRSFQAVQQELAGLAGEAAAARAAVEFALSSADLDSTVSVARVATAKVRAGLAAGAAARAAHQMHGAIGITLEYGLHRHTRSLWSWRDEYGDESEWSEVLHAELLSEPTLDPWDWLMRM